MKPPISIYLLILCLKLLKYTYTVIPSQYYTNVQLFLTNTTHVKIAMAMNELVNFSPNI